jgi:hypothetical protein
MTIPSQRRLGRQSALASANASLAAELSGEASAQAAQASAPISQESGSGQAYFSFVVATAGPYVVRYALSGCSNDYNPTLTILTDLETRESLQVGSNPNAKPVGEAAVYLAAGNWNLSGGGLTNNGNYDPNCRWTYSITPNG